MRTAYQRHLPVAGTFNIRDLGGYALSGGETRWRRLLRADGLHRLDAEGMAALTREGVTTIIDLRRDEELRSQPNPFHGHPAVAYHNVSLFDALDPKRMAEGDVLLDLYRRALSNRPQAFARVFTLIAEAPDGVVLFHCTAGKDRTGLIAALILSLAGVETPLVLEDYALTARMIEPMIEEIITHAVARGADVESFRLLLACEARTMAGALAHIVEEHGSVERYLAAIGLPGETIARLRKRIAEED